MKTTRRKTFISLLLAAAMIITSSITAFADYDDWHELSGYPSGIIYQYQGQLDNVSGVGLFLDARIKEKNNQLINTNYMGAMAKLYDTSDVLVASTGVIYNSIPSQSLYVWTSINQTGSYCGQMMALLAVGYNSNTHKISYAVMNSPMSPYVYYVSTTNSAEPPVMNAAVSSEEISSGSGYKVNAAGETYGTCRSAEKYEDYPDLIKARGVNGRTGYVRRDDFIYLADSPEDAERYTEDVLDGMTIPVYDLNGSVIDNFAFTGSNELDAR